MDHTEPVGTSLGSAGRPRWSGVLRALRQARGVTVDGWGARLGVSGGTVKRWERGERVPDPGAEAALLAYCREAGLFRLYDHGPLAGLDFSAELLRNLLAEARWRAGGAPAGRVPTGDPPAEARPDAAPPVLPHPWPSGLPAQLTSFVGRQREIAVVRRLQASTRLLTLTGVGGCGKTRLALALAEEQLWAYPHGVWLVDLAALADPALVPPTVAAALGLRTVDQQPVTEALVAFLRPRHLLLVLDNCEHLLAACARLVNVLLRACPNLEILATSREPLGVGGEAVWRVPPMELPPVGWTCAELEQQAGDGAQFPAPDSMPDSVRLLLERAQLHRSDFQVSPHNAEAVATICRRLDGLPLALELAAARVKVLSPDQIATRLGDRFQLLTGGDRTVLPRQQTLRATIDWSHGFLTTSEQVLLRRLSVFAGGFTLEAAEAMCGSGQWATQSPVATLSALPAGEDVLDLLTHLVDKSLVIADERGGEMRYRLLETIRQYAAERLAEAEELRGAREQHALWCLTLVESAVPRLIGPEQGGLLPRLTVEHDNFRAALDWCVSDDLGGPLGMRLAGALSKFWHVRGHVAEGRRWLAALLAADGSAPPAVRARALDVAGQLARDQGDYDQAIHLHEQGVALGSELGDDKLLADSFSNLAIALDLRGDPVRARTLFEESLALRRKLGDRHGIAVALNNLGISARRQGEYDQAVALYEECLALNRELGDTHGIALAMLNLGNVHLDQNAPEPAAARYREGLSLSLRLHDRLGAARCLAGIAVIAGMRGDAERAARLCGAAAALREAINVPLPSGDRSSYERATVAARAALGEAEFTTAWTAGQAMTLEEVAAIVLSDAPAA